MSSTAGAVRGPPERFVAGTAGSTGPDQRVRCLGGVARACSGNALRKRLFVRRQRKLNGET
jgi:hypothetical protein